MMILAKVVIANTRRF